MNPDVELQLALAAAGSEHIAPVRGWVDTALDDVVTTLAMVQDYAANSADGWATALGSVRDLMMEADLYAGEVGTDFAGEAQRMGAAVADVHESLARTLGTGTVPVRAVAAGMTARLDAAVAEAPELEALAPRIRAVFDDLADGDDLEVQRIHGDLHLGQVLRTPERWLLIDFEGEPAKSLAERRTPDSVLRDVAGMARSFDYAAHFPLGDTESDARSAQREFRAREWADRNVDAFCRGYAERIGVDPRATGSTLEAYVLDKAVYEVLYEKRNRPGWIGLPLGAIERVLAAG
ncbi:hypothetical protein Rrhod_0189 [Rhodococcus rhodnii LMG 5362]|uniref:Uncharacterized protein n=1 Tax=Rhodococcus rhodnii LMG 5362 TaxID=1273125 RepID=R7WSW4_9NOCA|nr:hypothetical protein Rrhod_0189 [Rhodococcus rhodnii LMG 5362]